MPSVRYFNQTAPFWDFIANLESNGANHPFFAAYNPQSRENHGGPGAGYRGPSHHDVPPPPPPPPTSGQDGPEASHPPGPPPPEYDGPEGPPPHNGAWGPEFPFGRHCGGFRRGGWGGRGGHRGHRGAHHGGPPFGAWANGDFDMSKIAEFFSSHFGAGGAAVEREGAAPGKDGKDFEPAADVFDTEDAFIVHISVPGAKKEDVGVNWDADKSELSVAGVIYRPGSEEFLKTLALDERKVGVFERKVRLGSRASPAQVDMDGISAKMEDGILMVTIPKEDKDFVDVKKVDIE